ncbi:mitochondrial transmembrane protein 53-like protein [Andalucia godoyi]|uniref:Mitochondrial transmembrane protein 53-like protein n=1 Tax=Andalucia godoyi TaxID=505711 RepID=A0A8K0F1C2_ANDGO|nr:mitochondrial transmembrane protein 53-like protein [Andalucia godoyi]|eukprot:ANDGO_02332.mRNA.1 mitochondrial transmembrane protein 53-like protein
MWKGLRGNVVGLRPLRCLFSTLKPSAITRPIFPKAVDRPICIVVGWLGAHSHHVAKYADWWNRCGVETISVIPSPLTVLSERVAQKEANTFLAKNPDSRFENRSIVYHLLSGNGVHFAAALLRNAYQQKFGTAFAMEKHHENDNSDVPVLCRNAVACIVDSAPPKISAERFTGGFLGALNSRIPFVSDRKDSILRKAVTRAFEKYLETSEHRSRLVNLRNAYIKLQKRCPHLFLYSDADTVIPPADVEEFIRDLEDAKFDVRKKMFVGSEHVAHFKVFPEEYSKEILTFLDSIPLRKP